MDGYLQHCCLLLITMQIRILQIPAPQNSKLAQDDCMFLEYCVSGCTLVLEEGSHDCPEEEDVLLLEPDFILAEEHFLFPETEHLHIKVGNFKSPAPRNS